MARREGIFRGFGQGDEWVFYPAWRYHADLEPLIVKNTSEDEIAKAKGYDELNAGMMANRNIVNWYWDLEDMSPKQLMIFAKEEYGVDFPPEASQEVLLGAVFELARSICRTRNDIVLIAHTIQMNYDQTLEEIRKMTKGGDNYITEVETKEITI